MHKSRKECIHVEVLALLPRSLFSIFYTDFIIIQSTMLYAVCLCISRERERREDAFWSESESVHTPLTYLLQTIAIRIVRCNGN